MLLILPASLIVLGLLVVPVLAARRFGRMKIVVPLATALSGLALWLAWSAAGEDATWDRVASVEARTLKITYTGSECEDHRSVSVDQSSTSIVISVKTWSFASGCSDVGFQHQFNVTLDSPLGDRVVLDGNCTGSRTRCERPISG